MTLDLMNLSVWLIHSLIKELDVKDPKWRLGHQTPGPILMPLSEWAHVHPEGFPKFKTHIYKLFVDWDLEFGATSLADKNYFGGYNEHRKMILLNTSRLHQMVTAQGSELKVVEVLVHELRHAYDDLISKGQGLGSAHFTDYESYLAMPAEIRARFTQMEPELMQELYFANGEIKHDSYFRVIMPELMKKYELTPSQLSGHRNPQKIYQKLISKAWLLKQSMDKLTDAQRAQMIQGLKSTQQMPAQTKQLWQKIKRMIEIF